MDDQPLTPEREQEIREKLVTEGRTFGVKGTRELLAEIDRLRDELGSERDRTGRQTGTIDILRGERDRLRADLDTAREALKLIYGAQFAGASVIASEALDRIDEQ